MHQLAVRSIVHLSCKPWTASVILSGSKKFCWSNNMWVITYSACHNFCVPTHNITFCRSTLFCGGLCITFLWSSLFHIDFDEYLLSRFKAKLDNSIKYWNTEFWKFILAAKLDTFETKYLAQGWTFRPETVAETLRTRSQTQESFHRRPS
jgi:hypothetical protein